MLALINAEELGITSKNVDKMLGSKDPKIMRFLGVTAGNGKALGLDLPLIVVVNKCDEETQLEDFRVFCELLEGGWTCIPLSARTGLGLDNLQQEIFDRLNIMRVYSKAPGKEPDKNAPFVLDNGTTVEAFAGKVHKDFVDNLKSARVWGSSDFDGQMVSRDYVLKDGDIVELKI